ncbi:hypothetical protein FE257_000349 [Aspergillus nanangensis]|uniref:BZIP domain-containing protein n=1 Tax=Aspergillus nanangensis TaxID=2582783 RepID=A0AAD4D0Z4_ASPNN|nr:hypothetical protein FE257_000349 [Aspergillus nanangensis]
MTPLRVRGILPPPAAGWLGSLNFSIASRSSSSLPTNITPFDFTSFTTDNHQQTWLPSPPPQQPSAHHLNSNNNSNSNDNNSLQEDFVLYPATRPRDPRAPAPSNTTPRLSAYNPQLVRSGHLSRRHALSLQQHLQQQQLSGSPVQVPRPTRLVSQSTGFPLSSSLRSSPSHRKHNHFLRAYAATVASNSASPASNSAVYSHRPPVPLFNSPANPYYQQQQERPTYHRRIMSTPNIAQDFPDLLDFSAEHFGSDFDAAMEPTMLSPHQIPTGIMASKDPLGVPTGTISPKDLLMDASAPPSTAFTDLSTPSFESPGYFSQDTSPMFASDLDLVPGHEEWDPLFPSHDGLSIPFDTTALELPTAPAPAPVELKEETPCASPMLRTSSQAPSPGPTRSGTKHSTVAGVNARQRKPLPPIKFNNEDPVAMKRARNTEAARKSRARKLERQDVMERRIADLEKSLEEAQQREQYWKALAENRA